MAKESGVLDFKTTFLFLLFQVFQIFISILISPIIFIVIIFSRLSSKKLYKPRLVWGSTPIISYSYWSNSMVEAGFESETFTTHYYSAINKREDWDIILSEKCSFFWWPLRPYCAFIFSLIKYDVFFISFDGFFLGSTPLNYYQAQILKMAGKKIIVLPYGSDSYVYRNIRSVLTMHGLLMSYPGASRKQDKISKNVKYWTKHADVLVTGIMGPDGFGRWDVLMPSHLMLDLKKWHCSRRTNISNEKSESVTIGHAPNHRGFKGTEFIIAAIETLKKEGFRVELKLFEKMQNEEVKKSLREDIDILVEQIISTGHGLNGLEGMASGLPTISNLEDESYTLPFRRWSYFSECPLVSATPENLVEVLRKLVTRPELRHQLGSAGRAYVEKYHGLDSAQYLFSNVIDYVYGRKESLINLYHPLLGEYPNRLPKIQHPLVNNRIVD